MHRLKNFSQRSTYFAVAMLLSLAVALPVFVVPNHTAAAQLTSRSITLSSSANGNISTDVAGNAVSPGAGGNGAKAKHTVKFTMASSGATTGSFLIMYCDSPIFTSTCNTPTGFDAANLTAISAGANNAATLTGLALDTTTSNATINSAIPANTGVCNGSGTTRTNCVAATMTATGQSGTPVVELTYGGGASDYIKNPTTDNYSFYARVVVFSDTGYTTQVDYGGVAMSTAQQIDITAKVQEVLNFSVGSTVTAPGGSCTAFSDSGALTLGDSNGVLSFGQAYDNHSYFRVSTNTLNGTVIYYSGDTLKSGANSITAAGVGAGGSNDGFTSTVGSKQFGLAIDSSDTQSGSGYSFTDLAANDGTNISGYLHDYGDGAGTITNGGTARFLFDTGSTTSPKPIARSTGAITCDTGSVRYIGNISTNTTAGIYTTTVTYLATGTY